MGAPPALLQAIAARLAALNQTIAGNRALGPQFCVGHSFVTPVASPGDADAWQRWYRAAVAHEIGPLLREYWYDDANAAEEQMTLLLQPL